MKRLDNLYRAFADYRKNTVESRDCVRYRNLFAHANAETDIVKYERVKCDIDDDWIVAIEKGLECIGKAIEEERQFIRNNGEVVPIEKVKKVSKESVDHLSRHSNLLTRYTEGEDIIPDQLYTVELLSDYAVYENRFLYMTLCYLRDFITLRYDKILEYCNTYNGQLRMSKRISVDGRVSEFTVSLDDSIYYDFLSNKDEKTEKQIERIGNALKDVMSYLATPLMESVAKAPMLKPPITETNVLKMNRNFNGALELYYFVTAYDKLGYTTNKLTTTKSPFNDEFADRFAEVAELCSFLTYEYGTDSESILKARYLEEEKRRRVQEEERLREQLEKLRNNIKDSGLSPEEYMLMLERRNLRLEKDSAQLKIIKAEIERQNEEIKQLNVEKTQLAQAVDEGRTELRKQAEQHEAELNEIKVSHEQEIGRLNSAHASELSSLRLNYTTQIEKINADHGEKIAALNEEFNARIEKVNQQLSEQSAACEQAVAQMEENSRRHKEEISQYTSQIEKLREDNTMISAKYNAVRREHGLFTADDDFTSQESFDEIERQYKMFTKFFNEEWKKTKKKIRKEAFSAIKNSKDNRGDGTIADTDISGGNGED